MSDIQKIYIKDAGKCLTPVYIPFETYTFYINGEYFTDPDTDSFDLQVVDKEENVVASNFANLLFTRPFSNANTFIYQIFCVFAFPKIDNGEYFFRLYKNGADKVLLTSNVILVENEITNTTTLIEYGNNASIFGFDYVTAREQNGFEFRNIFRLPIAQVDLQFDREIKNYRNISDKRLRTIRSFRDTNIKIEARGFDDLAQEAFSAVLEHSVVIIDGMPVEPKTAITVNTNAMASLNKSSFEAYTASPDEQFGIFNRYGQLRMYGGDFESIVDYIFDANEEAFAGTSFISEDGFVLSSEGGDLFIFEG